MAARRTSASRSRTATRSTGRTTGTKSSTAKKSAPAKPVPATPTPGPGERIFVLSVPFEERAIANANGAHWDPATRQTLYIGARLPYGLTPYASADYSWERWIEDDLNGTVQPPAGGVAPMTPRPHQIEAATKIADAAARGYRGFLEADDVGLGKTLASLDGAYRVAAQRGATRMLIMCPKAVIPHWRRTIAAFGDRGLRICVINYDQSKKLLSVPDSAATAKRTRTKNKHIADRGTSLVDWDLILFDEAHRLKNADSQRAKAANRIARYAEAARTAPFVIWMSATAGQNPPELSYLAPLFAQITGAARSSLKDFGQWLADQGFAVTYNKRFDKWEWGVLPEGATPADAAAMEATKEADLARIRALLFDRPDAPSIRRLPTDIAGWPEIQRIAFPVDLDPVQRHLYEQAWTAFREEMRLARRGRDPKVGMVARLRFRQKASLIRVPGTVELILDLLENGHQVAVSVEFLETADALREELAKHRIDVAEYTGRNTGTREQERFAFQRGQQKVIAFSVTEGISLHQNEPLGDGSIATNVPRTAIVHDPRYSGLASLQIEGRTHRDGQAANVYYAYAAGTVEEQVTRTLVHRVLSTKAMVGDDVTAVRTLVAELDATVDAVTAFDEPSPAAAPAAAPMSPAPPPASTSPPPQASRQTPAPGRRPGLPTTAPSPAPTRRAPSRAPGSRSVTGTPEEELLRAALAGGNARRPAKKAPTQADRDALRDGMRHR